MWVYLEGNQKSEYVSERLQRQKKGQKVITQKICFKYKELSQNSSKPHGCQCFFRDYGSVRGLFQEEEDRHIEDDYI